MQVEILELPEKQVHFKAQLNAEVPMREYEGKEKHEMPTVENLMYHEKSSHSQQTMKVEFRLNLTRSWWDKWILVSS